MLRDLPSFLNRHPCRLAALRRAARRYASHGWPVVPGAVLERSRFSCGPGCQTVGCHPGLPQWERAASVDLAQIGAWWRSRPRAVLLATGRAFDVLELPGRLGRAVLAAGRVTGPVAVTPTDRWLFLVGRGDALRAEFAASPSVVLHRENSWFPAPPTAVVEGAVRWRISPPRAGWHLPASWQVQQAVLDTRPAGTGLPAVSGGDRPVGTAHYPGGA